MMLWHTFHLKYWSLDELQKLPNWSNFDKIFLIGQEADILDYDLDDERIYVWDSLVVKDKPRYHHYFWWWIQTKEVEYYQENLTRLTDPMVTHPQKIFEFVIRASRPHREFLHKKIMEKKLQDKFFHNFNQNWIAGTDLEKTSLFDKNKGIIYYNSKQTANSSTPIPYLIYNNSWFSIVSETSTDKRFFTEKTAKSFLGKRLFVFFGAQHALQDLKYLGYKTFEAIVDESYDHEPDNIKRWEMAFEQIQWLCTQDPEKIYQQALPILEHNQTLFLTTDFNQIAIDQIKKIAHDNK